MGAAKPLYSQGNMFYLIVIKAQVEFIVSDLFFKAYEVIMYCTKHQNHNVVTASLETLLQLLRTPPPTLLSVLLSCEGITPTASSETFKGGKICSKGH